MTSEKMQ